MHYARAKKHGNPLWEPPARVPQLCSIKGCLRQVVARSWCNLHYDRWLEHRDPLYMTPSLAVRTRPLEERFWAKVDKDGPVPVARPELGPCWIWIGAKHRRGYGVFGKSQLAHRVAWELSVGPIPDDLHHECCTLECVRPSHLLPVTPATHPDNAGGTQRAKTHCPRDHPYEGDNLIINPQGHRFCRTCRIEEGRRRWKLAKEARQALGEAS